MIKNFLTYLERLSFSLVGHQSINPMILYLDAKKAKEFQLASNKARMLNLENVFNERKPK